MIKAMPHQIEAIKHLVNSRGFMLADDMGLGKTYTALLAARQLGRATTVICPSFLKATWEKSSQAVGISVDIFSYTKAQTEISSVPEVLILDESHYIKSSTAQRTKFCLDLCGLVRNRGGVVWLLTGTPITRDTDDLYTQLQAIDAIPLNRRTKEPWSLWGFKEALMNRVPDKHTRSGVRHEGITEDGRKLLNKMRENKYLRRTKDEVLNLPDKIYTKIYIAETSKSLAKELASYEDLDLMALEGNTHFMSLRKTLAILKAVKVARALKEELKEAPKQVVVFSAHVDAVKELAKIASSAIRVETITGATPPERRQAIVDDFQAGRVHVLAATIGAAGIGLTLTSASDVRFVDRSFSPAENFQAEDRCYRIGQDSKVVVTDYLTNDKIEERLLKLVLRKQETILRTN